MKNKKTALTLSEILIALAVLGVIAAILIGVLYKINRWTAYKSRTLKTLAVLDRANVHYHITRNRAARCGYWVRSSGDGTDGIFRDCHDLYIMYTKTLNIMKICEKNAYEQGCIPNYEGFDTVFKSQNPQAGDDDLRKALSGCEGFKKEEIKKGAAFVLSDGSILFPYENFASGRMAVDVNGMSGPNKWGYDVRVFSPKMMTKSSDPRYYPGGCEIVEPGGKSTQELLYGDISK